MLRLLVRSGRADTRTRRRWLKPSKDARTWHPSQVIESRSRRTVILSLEGSHLREVERFALSWMPDCEVLEPVELREKVAVALEGGRRRNQSM
jgi:predicted DNA-binding transcriptional regulator YafY